MNTCVDPEPGDSANWSNSRPALMTPYSDLEQPLVIGCARGQHKLLPYWQRRQNPAAGATFFGISAELPRRFDATRQPRYSSRRRGCQSDV